MALAAFTAPGAGASKEPVTLGQGVILTPADGWASAANVWEVGPGAVSLQKAGVLAAFAADAYGGTAQELLDEQLASVRNDFRTLRLLPVAPSVVSGDMPALKVLFAGTSVSRSLEGELVVAATGRIGVVMLAVAPPGQIARAQSDLDEMLHGLAMPR